MKILVAGATGKTGQNIVKQLLAKGIEVKALVRNWEKGKELFPEGVDLIVGDVLNPKSLETAFEDCNVLLCATGATPSFNVIEPYLVDYQGTKNLVDLAKAKGIEHFVLVSSLCVSQFFHPLNLFWLVLFWKKQAENYIQESGLTYTIVRPGGLKTEDNNDNVVMSAADTLFEGSIPRAKVAQVCIEALSQPAAKNKIVEIVAQADAPQKSWEELFSSVA
jgi:uncharacterized protein YbjT (DUF2867 family)